MRLSTVMPAALALGFSALQASAMYLEGMQLDHGAQLVQGNSFQAANLAQPLEGHYALSTILNRLTLATRNIISDSSDAFNAMAKDVKPQLVAPYIRSYADQVRTATADLRTSIAAHGTAYDANNLSEVSLKLVSLAIDARQLLELSKVRGSPARTHATLAHQVDEQLTALLEQCDKISTDITKTVQKVLLNGGFFTGSWYSAGLMDATHYLAPPS